MESVDVAGKAAEYTLRDPSESTSEVEAAKVAAREAVKVAGNKIARLVTLTIGLFEDYDATSLLSEDYGATSLLGMPVEAVEGSSAWKNVVAATLDSAVAYAPIVDVNRDVDVNRKKVVVAKSEALAMFNKAIAAEAASKLAAVKVTKKGRNKPPCVRVAEITAEEADKVAKVTTEMAARGVANAAARGVAEEVDDAASDLTICSIGENVAKCVRAFWEAAGKIYLVRENENLASQATDEEREAGDLELFDRSVKVATAAFQVAIIRGGTEFARAVSIELEKRLLPPGVKDGGGVDVAAQNFFAVISASEMAERKARKVLDEAIDLLDEAMQADTTVLPDTASASS